MLEIFVNPRFIAQKITTVTYVPFGKPSHSSSGTIATVWEPPLYVTSILCLSLLTKNACFHQSRHYCIVGFSVVFIENNLFLERSPTVNNLIHTKQEQGYLF